MMSRRAVDIWVGFFVLLGVAAIMFLSLQVASSRTLAGGDGYVILARFDNIGGLKIRAPVRSAGVLVGRVTDIRFDNESFEAVVTLQVDRRYQFPKDTSAKILTSGLLGEQYVGLAAGGDTANLQNGDTLRITQSALVLENLIGQFLYSKAAEGNEKKQ
jgi:phospholipid/cholesterol/gamma-HCH transport system substrate-binding protein